MRTLYKSIFVVSLAAFSLNATAQKDSTIIRQVLLEREYNPTLQDASKINVLPDIYTPVVQPKERTFISTAPQITLSNNQLGAAESGDIKTTVDFSKKRGYLNLGAGTHSNLDGALGYRIVNADRDILELFGTHSSTSGTVDYIDGKNYILEDVKAKYSASKVNLKYQHIFEPSILSIGASFYNTSYNYYGNSFLGKEVSAFPFDLNSRQNVNVFSIGAGLQSSETNEGVLKYLLNLNYRNFTTKYGMFDDSEKPKGGQFDLDWNFFAELEADKYVGVKGSLMSQSISKKNEYMYIDDTRYHGFTNVTASPYLKFQGANWNVDLGVNLNGMFDKKTKFMVSPNILASVNISDVNKLYAEVTGGVNNNTFLDILQENRYVNLSSRVEYSKTVYDAKVGFRSGAIDGFEFDIFGGYKKTDRDHLYLFSRGGVFIEDYTPVEKWSNMSTPVYADISTGHIGGLIKTNLIPYTDLSAKLSTYFYSVKYVNTDVKVYDHEIAEKKAWGRPTFTAELNADVKPFDKITLSLNYLFAGGRKTYFVNQLQVGSVIDMKNINELNFRGEYQITDWVSANVRLNNIFFQKYELQYGYPLQGFNVLGGLSFKF